MEQSTDIGTLEKKVGYDVDSPRGSSVGEFHQVEGGWLRYGYNGREEFTPDSLVFRRRSGKL